MGHLSPDPLPVYRDTSRRSVSSSPMPVTHAATSSAASDVGSGTRPRTRDRGSRLTCPAGGVYKGGMGYTDAPLGWWQEFISATPARTAKLAIVRIDGSPHVAPVWVDLDGDEVVFMTSADTVKGKAILRDSRVSLCWDDEQPPFSFVTISGTASTSTDRDTLIEWATRIGERYMGPDRAEDYGRRNAVPPEMVVRVRPYRIIAKVNVAD